MSKNSVDHSQVCCKTISVATEASSLIIFVLTGTQIVGSLDPSTPQNANFLRASFQLVMNTPDTLDTLVALAQAGFWISSIAIGVFLFRFYVSYMVFDIKPSYGQAYLVPLPRWARIFEWVLRCLILMVLIYGLAEGLRSVAGHTHMDTLIEYCWRVTGWSDVGSGMGPKTVAGFTSAFAFLIILYMLMILWVVVMLLAHSNKLMVVRRFGISPLIGLFNVAVMFAFTVAAGNGMLLSLFMILFIITSAIYLIFELYGSYGLLCKHDPLEPNEHCSMFAWLVAYFSKGICKFE